MTVMGAVGTGALDLRAGGTAVTVLGAERLRPRMQRWMSASLHPLRQPASGSPEVSIEVSDRHLRPGRRFEEGMALLDAGLWVGDRYGRGGVLAVADGRLQARVGPDIPPAVFGERFYLFLLGAALARRGGALLRLAAVDVGARRVAIGGWSGVGKSRLVLTLLLRQGGRLVGDGVVAALPDGSIAPVLGQVKVRPEHHDLVPVEATTIALCRERATRLLEGREAGSTRLSVGLAERIRERGEQLVGVEALVPGRGLASPAPIDRLVLLGTAPGIGATDFLTGTADVYFATHHLSESVIRATWPGLPAFVPGAAMRRGLIGELLADVPVTFAPGPLLPAEADRLARELTA